MTNKEHCKRDKFNPMTSIAGFFETIAVVAFLVMVLDLLGGSSENQVAELEVIGLLVLLGWLIRKIDKLVRTADDNLIKLPLFSKNVVSAGALIFKPIDPNELCLWHKHGFQIARGLLVAVTLPLVVILGMYSLAEGSSVTATVWKWTYMCTVSIMGICLAWMIGTVFHARRWGCAKDGLKHGE